MKKQHSIFNTVLFLVVSLLLISGCSNLEKPVVSRTDVLSDGWQIEAGDDLEGITGEAISQKNFQSEDWHDAMVPGTVLGSLVSGGEIEDPYFGINMKKVDPDDWPPNTTHRRRLPWLWRTSIR